MGMSSVLSGKRMSGLTSKQERLATKTTQRKTPVPDHVRRHHTPIIVLAVGGGIVAWYFTKVRK